MNAAFALLSDAAQAEVMFDAFALGAGGATHTFVRRAADVAIRPARRAEFDDPSLRDLDYVFETLRPRSLVFSSVGNESRDSEHAPQDERSLDSFLDATARTRQHPAVKTRGVGGLSLRTA
jgi:hypothetical protein